MLGKQGRDHLPVTIPAAGVRTPLCAFTAVLQKTEANVLEPSYYTTVGGENYIVETTYRRSGNFRTAFFRVRNVRAVNFRRDCVFSCKKCMHV